MRKLWQVLYDNPEGGGGGTGDQTAADQAAADKAAADKAAADQAAADQAEADRVAAEQAAADAAKPPATVPLTAFEAERKRRQAAAEEAAYWRGKAEAGGKAPDAVPIVPIGPPKEPAPAKKLNHEDFAEWALYEAAQDAENARAQKEHDKWMEDSLMFKFEEKQRQQEQQKTVKERLGTYQERLDKAAEVDPEIADIANNWNKPGQYALPLAPAMQDAIVESDVGPEILRHLYNNKQEAARIARLTPIAAVREMLVIEGKIKEEIIKNQPRRVSGAPPPITPVSAQGEIKDDDDKRPAADVIAEYRKASFNRR